MLERERERRAHTGWVHTKAGEGATAHCRCKPSCPIFRARCCRQYAPAVALCLREVPEIALCSGWVWSNTARMQDSFHDGGPRQNVLEPQCLIKGRMFFCFPWKQSSCITVGPARSSQATPVESYVAAATMPEQPPPPLPKPQHRGNPAPGFPYDRKTG